MDPTRNNVRTNLVGDGNKYKISNTTGGDLQVSKSSMSIRNCTLIRLNGNQHHVHLRNCSNVVVDGVGNALCQHNTINVKVSGERNAAHINDLSNFDLTGDDNVCRLRNEKSSQSSQISGNENRVDGSANRNFTVCGNGNFIQAENNKNLRIQASQSKIVAHRSSNITINGSLNEIALWMWNFELKHRLMRNLSGSANLVSITTNNIEEPSLLFLPDNNDADDLALFRSRVIPNVEEWLCQGQSYMPLIQEFPHDLMISSTTRHMSQLDISYVDQMSITQKDYVLGIFHFTLEHLKRATEEDYTSFLGIQVHSSELDDNSFTLARMSEEMEDRIILTGRKNGILQTIRFGGPQIMSCENGSQFIVNLNPLAAVQDEAVN